MCNIVKEINCNINNNNTNGSFSISNILIFYKLLDKKLYNMELTGYETLKKYYKVPRRYFNIENKTENIVGYEYHKSDLLVDYFSENDNIDHKYLNILDIYKNVFTSTLRFNKKQNCKIFFEDRLDTRLKDNVFNEKTIGLNNKIVKLNGESLKLNILEIYDNIIQYFSSDKKTWNIISNCDPNDLNICIDGYFFDYTASGYVPLMCEAAVFICYNLIQGEYLALKYNPKAFEEHKNIYKKQNIIEYCNNSIMHTPRSIRIEAINNYLDIIEELIKKIDYKDWYLDFKNYFVMKLLAVIDFKIVSLQDITLSLSYVSLFYNNNFKNISEFKKFINKLYGGEKND